MQVKQYLFQSPYSSPVQYGRVDPTTKDTSTQTQQLLNTTNQTMSEAKTVQATQTQEVTPTVSSSSSTLDLYA